MKVLVVAPHADDEVLGLGATMAKHVARGDEVVVAVMTGHGQAGPHPVFPPETWDTVRAEARRAHQLLGVSETLFEEVPAAMVGDQALWQINKLTLEIVRRVEPEVLYVPFLFDLHRDHRELAHSFSVAMRPCSPEGRAIREVLMYETPSETHWNMPYLEAGFLPNHWVDISDFLSQKLEALRCFESQMQPFPHARSVEALEALARWRGSQIGLAAAEAFVLVRRIC